jgi:hypothetical protein
VRRRSNLKLTEYLSIVVSDNILQSTRSRSIHDIEADAIAKIKKELTHDVVPSLIVTDKRQPRSREREGLWWNGRTIKELLPLSSAAGAALQPVSRGQGVRARKPRRA